jgi:hypothetical protein
MHPESMIFFRDQFRAGRAAAFRNAESFQEIVFALERLGASLTCTISDLGKYKNHIQELAIKSPLAAEIPEQWRDLHLPFSILYELVRRARNDALHQGAFARHLTDHAVQLALTIEDALMTDMTTVCDYMVREPSCALTWQPISFVRQQMLSNSYTYLPILLQSGGKQNWHLLSDTNIVKYLRPDRKKRLAKTVKEAIEAGEVKVEAVECCPPNTLIKDVMEKLNGSPVLIVSEDQPERLLGILAAFDLL